MIVYICGPLTMGGQELRSELLTKRIETAELVAAAVARLGYVPQMTHYLARHQIHIDATDQAWMMSLCLEALGSCGAIALIDGWEQSKGCVAEERFHRAQGGQYLVPGFAGGHPPSISPGYCNHWTRADALRILGVE